MCVSYLLTFADYASGMCSISCKSVSDGKRRQQGKRKSELSSCSASACIAVVCFAFRHCVAVLSCAGHLSDGRLLYCYTAVSTLANDEYRGVWKGSRQS